jgi:hypothetical protein
VGDQQPARPRRRRALVAAALVVVGVGATAVSLRGQEPAARAAAHGRSLFVAVAERGILESKDGGQTFRLFYRDR